MAQTRAASQYLFQVAQVLTVLLSCFSLIRVKAAPIELVVIPEFVEAEVNTQVIFNCSLPCRFEDDFTLAWLAGDAMNLSDRFLQFQSGTNGKISYQIKHNSSEPCNSKEGTFWSTLEINVSTIDLNRTPVQCVALPTVVGGTAHYGSYSLLKVSGPTPTVETTGCNPPSIEEKPSEEQAPPIEQVVPPTSTARSPTAVVIVTVLGLLVQILCSNL